MLFGGFPTHPSLGCVSQRAKMCISQFPLPTGFQLDSISWEVLAGKWTRKKGKTQWVSSYFPTLSCVSSNGCVSSLVQLSGGKPRHLGSSYTISYVCSSSAVDESNFLLLLISGFLTFSFSPFCSYHVFLIINFPSWKDLE